MDKWMVLFTGLVVCYANSFHYRTVFRTYVTNITDWAMAPY